MAPLRFRAWHKTSKKMFNQPKLSVRFEQGVSVSLHMDRFGEGKDLRWCVRAQDVVLMQSTGLKDKNGKEIFEGDIVRGWDRTFDIRWMTLSNCGDCTEDSGVGFNFYLNQPYELEVIGNIHENPDLLSSPST